MNMNRDLVLLRKTMTDKEHEDIHLTVRLYEFVSSLCKPPYPSPFEVTNTAIKLKMKMESVYKLYGDEDDSR